MRCFKCGSQGHQRKNCPTRETEEGQEAGGNQRAQVEEPPTRARAEAESRDEKVKSGGRTGLGSRGLGLVAAALQEWNPVLWGLLIRTRGGVAAALGLNLGQRHLSVQRERSPALGRSRSSRSGSGK
ncbi:UNVERIFIED_CONTAM: hypothetical protein FKN15_074539 [Acipenser sinensis]